MRAMCGVQLKIEQIYRFDVDVGFVCNHRSVGFGKQWLLVWPCVEVRGWSCLEKGIRL